ncbi:restriction endonuclease subunit S [Shewanella baltica]|uniref:restriction endonuclease subunit S n=1 Tax=Shewanella baltica TaxID=62322 RepID=UPI00217E6910|nr:restriction endonuclease subunit S [Shewanella baltica]MCS6205670.1 hypothetical protein [Shewanella baltica]
MSIVKFDDVANFVNGGAWNQSEYVDVGIPVVRVSDIHNGTVNLAQCRYLPVSALVKYSKNKLEKGDLVICTVGSHPTQPNSVVGRPGIMPATCEGALLNQNAVCIRPKNNKIDKDWLGYLARSQSMKDHIISHARGSASQVRVAISALKDFEFDLPTINEQKTISFALLSYDNLIENNNRRIAILEEMAQSLYREWFVNFRYPGHANQPDGSSDNKDSKPNLIDSPLGPIPEGWEVKRLDDFVTLQRGFDLPKNKRNEDGGIPIYAASGLTGYHDQVKAKGPGIVTGRSGTLGIVKLVLEDYWPLNTSLWVKKFGNCTAHYAYYLLDGIGLERFNSGASVPTLNRNDVHGNPVVAPPNDLIETFENIVSVNHKQINVLKRKNENLKNQRDMLLPKLISGQIELKD